MFRDPRDIVVSEHRMRIEVYEKNDTAELSPFIYQRFEVNKEAWRRIRLPYVNIHYIWSHAGRVLIA